ncbi:hypothetical protein CH371_16910 [Leptospira wolffii]|uniref:Acyltransferase n=1 Tax=Leptospira wolffii TaxID=409998 RepID=A0A2M9Z8P6_9LEPT|nr:hypothetical protein CH371_16910 [Leptospira wolffii]
MTSINSKKYRPDIDGLRALAISSVVLFHAFPDLIPGGFIGVDIFFVISGYLISTIIFAELDAGTFSFRDFYARRIRRIFPALWIVLLFCLIFGYFSLFSDEYQKLGRQTVAGVFFYSNFFFLKAFTDYFNPLAEQQLLLHLWSLGIEEQFYIFWPLFTFFAWKFAKANLLKIIILLTLISFGYNLWYIPKDPIQTFYLPMARAWELLSGTVLAWLHLYKKDWLKVFIQRIPLANRIANEVHLANIQSFLGIFLIFIGIFGISKENTFPGFLALLPTLGAFFQISAGQNAWFNKRILSNRMFVFIGLISFPLYLWHWPLLSFSNIMASGPPPLAIRIGIVLLSLFLSYLTMAFVEKKIRFRPERSITIALTLSLLCIGILGKSIASSNLSQYRGKQFESPKAISTAWELKQIICVDEFKTSMSPDNCQYNAYGKRPSVVLYGDSHANHYYLGLSKYFEAKSGENLMLIASYGCSAFLGVIDLKGRSKSECSKNQRIIEFLKKEPSIKTIIISGRGNLIITGKGFGKAESDIDIVTSYVPNPNLTDLNEIFKTAVEATVRPLVEAGKEVVLIADNPELGFHSTECGEHRPLQFFTANFRDPCAIPRKEFDIRNATYHRILQEIASDFPKGSVKIWDSWRNFCDDDWCWAKKDGLLLYDDDDHLSTIGSIWIGEQYDPK